MPRIARLFIDQPLKSGQSLVLDKDQAHYLYTVLRQKAGWDILLINGRDGEWQGTITELSKKSGTIALEKEKRPFAPPSDIWVCFSPLKKSAFDFAIEKATELGASKIIPILTDYTDSKRVNLERARLNIIESAQQCGALSLPELGEEITLDALIASWPQDRMLFVAAESGPADSFGRILNELEKHGQTPQKAAIMIGPEGGFSDEELAALRVLDFVRPVCLGSNILRAETALTAALSVWQALAGSWLTSSR